MRVTLALLLGASQQAAARLLFRKATPTSVLQTSRAQAHAKIVSKIKSTMQGKTAGEGYDVAWKACCKCFTARALAPTEGAPRQCGTCYVADTYGIGEEEKVTKQMGAKEGAGGGNDWMNFWRRISSGTQGNGSPEECEKVCVEKGCSAYGLDANGRCKIAYKENLEVTGFETAVAEGKTKSKSNWISDMFSGITWNVPGEEYVGTASSGGGGAEAGSGYTVTTQSKVEGIHSWFWTCADGYVQDDADWSSAAVEGGPIAKDYYSMCGEPSGMNQEHIQAACEDLETHEETGDDWTYEDAQGISMAVPHVYKPWATLR